MKKVVSPLLLVVVLAVAAVPCVDHSPEYPLGEFQFDLPLRGNIVGFDYFYKNAQLVADVEITKCYGSVAHLGYYTTTHYRGVIKHCYKNTTGKNLAAVDILQEGTPEFTLQGFSLFQTGDRLLLMLNPVDADAPNLLRECYMINGGPFSAIEIIESEDGDVCRTFYALMCDLPLSDATPAMQEAIRDHIAKKYVVPEGQPVPECPSYFSISYETLRSYIEQKYCK